MPDNLLRDMITNNNQIYMTAYREGLKDGICRYAWWKDGIQYVGTRGITLANALKEMEKPLEAQKFIGHSTRN